MLPGKNASVFWNKFVSFPQNKKKLETIGSDNFYSVVLWFLLLFKKYFVAFTDLVQLWQ